jgi:hypothetical protein
LRGDEGVKATYLTTGTALDMTRALRSYFDRDTPREKAIHVLVKLPDPRPTCGSPLGNKSGGTLSFHLICVKTPC